MAKWRPTNLVRQVTRHGKTVWYFRKDKGKRVRIPGVYGTPEFQAAYQEASGGAALLAVAVKASSRSLAWLIGKYQETSAWKDLAASTREKRQTAYNDVIKNVGDAAYAGITKKHIAAGIENRLPMRYRAQMFLVAMRELYSWAIINEYVKHDPTLNLSVKMPKSNGYYTWTESDIARFEAFYQIGTRERLALGLFLYTGLRRGDMVILGPQHVTKGWLYIKTGKTGTVVEMPIMPKLQKILDKSPLGAQTFFAGVRGKPMVVDAFGTWFRIVCNKAGCKGRAHGLRKAGAVRLAYAGATVKELMAIYGWTKPDMAIKYVQMADNKKLAEAGLKKLIDSDHDSDDDPDDDSDDDVRG